MSFKAKKNVEIETFKRIEKGVCGEVFQLKHENGIKVL